MRRVPFDIDDQDEITGVKTISIVNNPAIDSNFVVLARQHNTVTKRLASLILRAYQQKDFALIDRLRGRRGLTRQQLLTLVTQLYRMSRLTEQGFQLKTKGLN